MDISIKRQFQLCDALLEGDVDRATELFEQGATVERTSCRYYPARSAIMGKHWSSIEILTENGMDWSDST
ncbi:MAG: hypothetical protein N2C14_20860, partial [Planctomycetales bacterium]